MRSYPIWNKVQACVYKNNDKSYGVKSVGEVEVRVGTSGSNSHHFLEHKTTHKLLPNGDRVYKFSVDGKIIKEAILRKGANEIELVDLKDTRTECQKEWDAYAEDIDGNEYAEDIDQQAFAQGRESSAD